MESLFPCCFDNKRPGRDKSRDVDADKAKDPSPKTQIEEAVGKKDAQEGAATGANGSENYIGLSAFKEPVRCCPPHKPRQKRTPENESFTGPELSKSLFCCFGFKKRPKRTDDWEDDKVGGGGWGCGGGDGWGGGGGGGCGGDGGDGEAYGGGDWDSRAEPRHERFKVRTFELSGGVGGGSTPGNDRVRTTSDPGPVPPSGNAN